MCSRARGMSSSTRAASAAARWRPTISASPSGRVRSSFCTAGSRSATVMSSGTWGSRILGSERSVRSRRSASSRARAPPRFKPPGVRPAGGRRSRSWPDAEGADRGLRAASAEEPGLPLGFAPGLPAGFAPGLPAGFAPGFAPGLPAGFSPGFAPGLPAGFPPGFAPGLPAGFPPGLAPGLPAGFPPGFAPGRAPPLDPPVDRGRSGFSLITSPPRCMIPARQQQRPPRGVAFVKVCPAASYSPTQSPAQYHRR